jgi:hypothetical protein
MGFGHPNSNHSFLQEASFETCLLPLLQVGFFYIANILSIPDTHPLAIQLAASYVALQTYAFP